MDSIINGKVKGGVGCLGKPTLPHTETLHTHWNTITDFTNHAKLKITEK